MGSISHNGWSPSTSIVWISSYGKLNQSVVVWTLNQRFSEPLDLHHARIYGHVPAQLNTTLISLCTRKTKHISWREEGCICSNPINLSLYLEWWVAIDTLSCLNIFLALLTKYHHWTSSRSPSCWSLLTKSKDWPLQICWQKMWNPLQIETNCGGQHSCLTWSIWSWHPHHNV